jgi:hypothetical protein
MLPLPYPILFEHPLGLLLRNFGIFPLSIGQVKQTNPIQLHCSQPLVLSRKNIAQKSTHFSHGTCEIWEI